MGGTTYRGVIRFGELEDGCTFISATKHAMSDIVTWFKVVTREKVEEDHVCITYKEKYISSLLYCYTIDFFPNSESLSLEEISYRLIILERMRISKVLVRPAVCRVRNGF